MSVPRAAVCVVKRNIRDVLTNMDEISRHPYFNRGLDLMESRLDFLGKPITTDIDWVVRHNSVPKILTLRDPKQANKEGTGPYAGTPQERLDLIAHACATAEAMPYEIFIDVEHDVLGSLSSQARYLFREGHPKLILSYHNFEETPEDLEGLEASMRRTMENYQIQDGIVKIATMAQTPEDSERMLELTRKHPDKLITICMGAHGQITRKKAPLEGGVLTFAPLYEPGPDDAPGQVSLEELKKYWKDAA